MPHDNHALLEAVLLHAVEALEARRVPHALMGGMASAAMGRGRHTHDIDLFVTRADADRALDALATAGFTTERTDPEWLYKAFRDGEMVDVIFSSKGGVEFDDRMREHLRTIDVGGRQVLALSPEDLLVIKSLANAEHVPRHWYDGLAIIEANRLDWSYLLWRAGPYAGRVASLLVYALGDGLEVPPEIARELFERAVTCAAASATAEADHHRAAQVRQALATDPRANEPNLEVAVHGDEVVVRGQVATEARRRAVETVLRELVEGELLRCEIEVT